MKIYNTLTRKKDEFIPLEEGKVKIYACGPTVYNYIHIGNARPICVFDTLRRYLEYRGYEVKFVQNFTDIDDKIIKRANEEGSTQKEISEKYTKSFHDAMEALNLLSPDIEPKATENIASKEKIEMVKCVMKDYGIEVSGGITTVTPDLNESDKKRQRLFNTFCYCNEPMRARLKEVSEYTASLFDEFIIDDFFFTQCMCEDCLREKGNRSWQEFRLAKMLEVSENLIIKPAKKINPKINII